MRRSMGSRGGSSRSMGSRGSSRSSMGRARGGSRGASVHVHVGGRHRRRGYRGGVYYGRGNPFMAVIITLIVGIILLVSAFSVQSSVYAINNGVNLSYEITESVNADDASFNDYNFDVSGSIKNSTDSGTDQMHLIIFVKEDGDVVEYEFTFEVYANETYRLDTDIDVTKLKTLEVVDAMIYGLDSDANLILNLDESSTATQGTFVQTNASDIAKLSYNIGLLIVGIGFTGISLLCLIAAFKKRKNNTTEEDTSTQSSTPETAAAPAHVEKKWECKYCGAINAADKTKCDGCGAKRTR